jgi:hypothetical protein
MIVSMIAVMLLVGSAGATDVAPAQVAMAPTGDIGKVKILGPALGVPEHVNVQGYVTEADPKDTLTGSHSMEFDLWTLASGGARLWGDSGSVLFQAGLFSKTLTIPSNNLIDGTQRWLEITVDGQTLSPRVEVTSAAFAYRSIKSDTAVYAASASIPDGSVTTAKLANDAVTSTKILNGSIAADDLGQMGAGAGQVMKWTGSAWQPRNDSVASGTGGDNAWVRGSPDSVLFTVHELGLARAGNVVYGNYRWYHVDFGSECTTGTSGADRAYCTVSGGFRNVASGTNATVGGGSNNKATLGNTTVCGGNQNAALGSTATVSGGSINRASGDGSTVGGGSANRASGTYSVVSGGYCDSATVEGAVVGGGENNTASGQFSTITGGEQNDASGNWSTIGGGEYNTASGEDAAVAGGLDNISAGQAAFTAGYGSEVPSAYSYSVALNGMTATASNQTRVGTLSKAGGTFTIDHPLEPYGKILNHYFIEGPEMRNIYDGEAVLDSSGRAVVMLPGYFAALNRNPRVQLTGVGSADVVYLAQKVDGNMFVAGGKPGMAVYWQVTGERADMSAEAIRRLMPVEQPKTGDLAGQMLDDEFLCGCMEQLAREGKAGGIDFRTDSGRQRYEHVRLHAKPGSR